MCPTPFPDVNALLAALLSGAETILGRRFVGMYLHGSLAIGDFDPDRSDIDFAVVTDGELPADTISALSAMHHAIGASDLPWKTNYEGSYIPLEAIRRYDPGRSLHPAVCVDGSFGLDRHGSEWIIQRHILREWGIALAGPEPTTLIDPVSPDDLRQATRGVLREWWAPQVENPFRLQDSEYQAYAVLTMCRARYTLETGTVASKPVAARWAQGRLGSRWRGLIDRALAWRHGGDMDCFADAVELIRLTVSAPGF